MKYAGLLLKKGMQEDALLQLEGLLANAPACGRAHYLLAVIRASLDEPEQAILHFRQALAVTPEDTRALNGLGVALQQAGRAGEALPCFEEAIRLEAGYQDARINLASLLKDHGMLGEAETILADGVRITPGSVRLNYNLANVLQSQGRSLEAVERYRAALAADPDHLDARQNLLFALHYSYRFGDREICREHIEASTTAPFSPKPEEEAPPVRPPASRGRIRIGYVSADFRDHSVARFIEPVLAHHDKSRFEIFCYANQRGGDRVTERLKALADGWREIRTLDDRQAARMIAGDGIDILIDLAGHTSGNRLPLFARKPAPIQITWIGYPDTTGLSQMDYRITDATADPPGREMFHRERLIRLPRIFSCYLPDPEAPAVAPLPSLTSGRITFGSFNNLAKVTPEVLALWCRLLREVPEAHLLVKAKPLADGQVRRRLMEFFEREGIAAERVELHEGHPTTLTHLAHYGKVDIGLDTFPYNGTTTTCEALWMGVPVVTMAGSRHASRTGATMLGNCGLGNLVAVNPEEYLEIARGLAGNREALAKMRSGMRERLQASPLLDGAGVTRELEAALLEVAPGPLPT
nr:tetratricopeptide repeat protein [Geomonas sp. Red32]